MEAGSFPFTGVVEFLGVRCCLKQKNCVVLLDPTGSLNRKVVRDRAFPHLNTHIGSRETNGSLFWASHRYV